VGGFFFPLSYLLSLSLVRIYFFKDRAGRRAQGELATSRLVRTADRRTGKMYAAMIYIGRMRV